MPRGRWTMERSCRPSNSWDLVSSMKFNQEATRPAFEPKTMTSTMWTNPEEEAHHVDSENPVFAEPDEEEIIDVLLAEGDEDALILQQFEEALIESLQGDPDIAACLNTYVEARRKLQDKARSRGFLEQRQEFFGLQRQRSVVAKTRVAFLRTLANAGFLWRNEFWTATVPFAIKKGTGRRSAPIVIVQRVARRPLRPQPSQEWLWRWLMKVMTIMDPALPPPEQTVAFMAMTQDSFRDHVLGRSFNSTTYPENKYGYNKYRHRIVNGLQRIDWGRFRDRINSLTRMTPSHMTDPLIQKDVADSTPNKVEQAYFVSEGSLGIVDLGASLSVIGQSQFDDLCRHLPKQVLQSMKETPCQVKFPFGNDSSVTGTRAIFFPVGSFWIKVVVVPSNTPFLIANSVFRALGAVIDTEDASIYFQETSVSFAHSAVRPSDYIV